MGKKFKINLNKIRNIEGRRNCNCGKPLGCRGKKCNKLQRSKELYKIVKKSIKFL